MYIYSITNKINGKQYIGQTINTIEKRWYDHKYKSNHGEDKPLYNAFRKYGIQNFEIKQLSRIDSPDAIDWLNILEPLYIKYYNTLAPNGYNLMMGGNNKKHHPHSKIKIGLAQLGNQKSKGLKRSPQTLQLMSSIRIGKAIHSEEYKLKLGEQMIGNQYTKGLKYSDKTKKK